MNATVTQNLARDCPARDLAAYIEGELEAVRAEEIDEHLSGCPACRRELTLQKQFLVGLDQSLRSEGEIALPPDFTKRLVVGAESSVSGLRRGRERRNAGYVFVAVVVFSLAVLGADTGGIFDIGAGLIERLAVVAGVVGRTVYSVFLGFAFILRSLTQEFRLEFGALLLVPAAFAAFLFYLSRRSPRPRQA